MSHSFNKYGVSAAYFHCAWLLLEAVVCNYKRLNDTEERFQYCSDFQETWCQISIVHGLQVQLRQFQIPPAQALSPAQAQTEGCSQFACRPSASN
jgi:hypothetical protein